MSAGRSSQDAACFSVDRTKYLMFSKSMPARSEPRAGPPGRDRFGFKQGQPFQPQAEHPLRLVLLRRDVPDDVFGQAAARGRAGLVRVRPAELIATEPFELGMGCRGHAEVPPDW